MRERSSVIVDVNKEEKRRHVIDNCFIEYLGRHCQTSQRRKSKHILLVMYNYHHVQYSKVQYLT